MIYVDVEAVGPDGAGPHTNTWVDETNDVLLAVGLAMEKVLRNWGAEEPPVEWRFTVATNASTRRTDGLLLPDMPLPLFFERGPGMARKFP